MACSSNNCPLDNYVACNYYFYDSNGTPVTLLDTITVKTLRPGYKTVYIYRKFGAKQITLDTPNESLREQGYKETVTEQRRDTILINKLSKASSFQVPMSFFSSNDTLVISYSSIALPDTIKVTHDSYPHVELPECGSYRFHYLRNITSTDRNIDSISISNPQVNYEGNENVKIYLNGSAK